MLFALAWVSPALAADVWVNTNTRVYHCPGGQYYGQIQRGRYMTETEAVQRGYRAAYNRPCTPGEAAAAQRQAVQNLPARASDAAPATRVWINTGSGVYHCPGTRYYGATKRGRYASEAEAISTGNRPAHGTRCN